MVGSSLTAGAERRHRAPAPAQGYGVRMGVRTHCTACGITIDLDSPDVEVIARGDRFWHPSCIEVHTEPYEVRSPAYHLPNGW